MSYLAHVLRDYALLRRWWEASHRPYTYTPIGHH